MAIDPNSPADRHAVPVDGNGRELTHVNLQDGLLALALYNTNAGLLLAVQGIIEVGLAITDLSRSEPEAATRQVQAAQSALEDAREYLRESMATIDPLILRKTRDA